MASTARSGRSPLLHHTLHPVRERPLAADRAVAADRCFFSGAAHRHRVPGGSPGRALWAPAGRTEGPGYGGRTPLARVTVRPRCCGRGVCEAMGVSYYDALLPVREPGPALGAWWRVSGFLTGCSRRSACLRAGSFWPSFLIVPGSVACSRPTGLRRGRMPCRTPRCMRWPGRRLRTGWEVGRGAMVVAGSQDDDGVRIRLLPAGQGVRPGHLLGGERGRHSVLARMRIVGRRGN